MILNSTTKGKQEDSIQMKRRSNPTKTFLFYFTHLNGRNSSLPCSECPVGGGSQTSETPLSHLQMLLLSPFNWPNVLAPIMRESNNLVIKINTRGASTMPGVAQINQAPSVQASLKACCHLSHRPDSRVFVQLLQVKVSTDPLPGTNRIQAMAQTPRVLRQTVYRRQEQSVGRIV